MVDYDFNPIPEANAAALSEKQLSDYRMQRIAFIEWLLVRGKTPGEYKGYSEDTVKRSVYRVGKWERYCWQE